MSEIELVIKIPEGIIEYIKNNDCLSVAYIDDVAKAIINGTPLPKGHGKLIDENTIEIPFDVCDGEEAFDYVVNAPTIIEADKAESEDKE